MIAHIPLTLQKILIFKFSLFCTEKKVKDEKVSPAQSIAAAGLYLSSEAALLDANSGFSRLYQLHLWKPRNCNIYFRLFENYPSFSPPYEQEYFEWNKTKILHETNKKLKSV